jgi:tellurite resistance protein TehA-like permease
MLNREHVTDALKFWELARLPYNLVLAVIAAALLSFGRADIEAWLNLALPLFILAVIANVLYCIAYPVDLLIQASDFRAQRRVVRWGLWAVGTTFAGVLAYYTLGGPYIFGTGHG